MNYSRYPISALLITFNEEKMIGRALQSLTWADEIVIIDAFSTDRTKSIALDPEAPWFPKVRWIENPWSSFKDQRNYALQSATHDWVFVLDADEKVSMELANKILSILSEPSPHPYWKIRRQEYFLGKEIHYGVWNPSYQDRLFNKKGIQYVNDIHEYPPFPIPPKKIHDPIFHSPDFNPEHFLKKMNKYTSIEAQDRVNAGQRTHWFRILSTGPAMFLKNYFYYRAWKDGIHGVIISALEGVSRTVRHVKMWQYQNQIGKSLTQKK